ncbi:restriction endonuclease subunit S [Streptococcus suis]|uniref:restriction endonuclease subunit S n=1 Tax=Streptococcus suis TaxID=1307 RepID=UPI000CF474FC|nr:restriction endonuclease subunit S [Streptococcus suis]
MTKEKSTVPRLRFPGFTDAWKQRKLGEVGSTYTGLSGKTKDDFGHGDGRFVTYMNVFSNSVSSEDMLGLIEIDEKQNRVLWGDVFFTTSSETPEDVGLSSVWLGQADNIYLNSFCFGFRPKIKINPYYLAYMLRSPIVRRKIVFLAQGISRYNISKNKLMELEISLPALPEQEVIGSFFSDLDQLITLHQRKLDDVKELKKALLQKMFPKGNGNDFPELRFPKFTDAWKQRKLGEVADFSIKTNSLSRDKLSSYFYEVQNIHYGDILTKYDAILDVCNKELPSIIGSTISDFTDALLIEGDIVFADAAEDSTVGKAVEVRNFKGKNVVSGLHTIVARPKVSYAPYYLGYLINSTAYHNQILPLMQGTKVSSISKANLKSTIVVFPTLPEQEAIGNFFSDLDRLITLHQRQLDHLKLLKKALLQQMFI